ncbi:hypothetical protein AWB64_05444 [Caballeronia sordidicola]|uniref:DUF6311 domain-containing protein n=1 Tax=Caballeronia sordidicola TaxID=196367 RepID=A0A158I3C9_CABSO|nr:hypothetical protein [Caballeronia sordidicola]SAL51145.1 hypothetical protein AWB64_05444 [Caballeronia sordidicola]
MRRLSVVLPLVGYLAASLALFSHGISTGSVFQPGTDPIAYIWFLKWWPYAISHGVDPFLTHLLWSPTGFSVLWANSIPTLAILMWPVTALKGAETSWSVLCLAAPALNAYSAFLLLRYLVKNGRPAAIGGFIFGFSPYISSHVLGHISLTVVALVPLIALMAVRRANREISKRSFVTTLSLIVLLQFGISMEVLATSALFGSVAYVAFYLSMRTSLDMKGLAIDTLISAAICIVLLSPAFYSLWLGSKQLPKIINSPIVFSNDVLGFLVPMQTVWLGGDALASFTRRFSATASEQNAYLGVPLIVVAIIAFRSARQEAWGRPLGWTTLIAALMSLGPIVWIAGHHFKMPLPGIIAMFLPLLKHALPSRFALYTSLGIAVFVSAWLARSPSRVKYAFALLAAIFILPNPGAFSFVSYSTPTVFSDPASVDRLNQRGTVVVLPYGRAGNSILWQLRADFRFKMAGGYVGFTPKAFEAWPAIDYFSAATLPVPQPDFKTNVLAFCIDHGVGSIVVESGTPAVLTEQLHALHWPTRKVGDAEVIEVPSSPQ